MKRLSYPLQEEVLPELREEIHEALGSAGVYAGLAQTFAAIGDDAGLAYSLRKQVAYVRHAVGTFNELRDILQRAENKEAA